MSKRVTHAAKAARPVHHHTGEKAGGVKSFDGFIVQQGDYFVDAVVAQHSASQAVLNAALEVAGAASLMFGADLKEADRFIASWREYVKNHADFARVCGEDKTLSSNLSRAARIVRALVAGDVLPEDLPTDKGLRAASDACPKTRSQGRKATAETVEPADQPQSHEDAEIQRAATALVAKLKTAPDGHSLVLLLQSAPLACIAALRDLRDSIERSVETADEPSAAIATA